MFDLTNIGYCRSGFSSVRDGGGRNTPSGMFRPASRRSAVPPPCAGRGTGGTGPGTGSSRDRGWPVRGRLRRAPCVDEGRVMLAGHVHKPEILGRIAERYAVPAFLEGGGDLFAALQGNFTLDSRPPTTVLSWRGNSSCAERTRSMVLNVPSRDGWRRGSTRFSMADKQIS